MNEDLINDENIYNGNEPVIDKPPSIIVDHPGEVIDLKLNLQSKEARWSIKTRNASKKMSLTDAHNQSQIVYGSQDEVQRNQMIKTLTSNLKSE